MMNEYTNVHATYIAWDRLMPKHTESLSQASMYMYNIFIFSYVVYKTVHSYFFY